MKDDICHALIVVLSNTAELQGYSVRSLYKALQSYGKQVRGKFILLLHSIPFHLILPDVCNVVNIILIREV